MGRGDAVTAPGLVCGPCGTELPPNAKSYNQSAVPELPGPVDRLAAAPCSGSTGFRRCCQAGTAIASRSPLVAHGCNGKPLLRWAYESTWR